MNVWFTADTHFGHKNIIKYCNRPFATVKEMDEHYIEQHNKLVQPSDYVYHLGDVSFGPPDAFNRLNGVKHLVKGNHDYARSDAKYDVEWIKDIYELKVGDNAIVLCHYPILEWHKKSKGSYHFYGHVHGRLAPTDKSIDVGVDLWNYRPVNLEEIFDKLGKIVVE